MAKRIVLVTAVLLGWAVLPAAAGQLDVGDPAPKLAVKEFIKGEPVKDLEKGKVYVVEFWATWCGPCRATIPHLTEMQKKYKDVVFIGVSAFEHDPKGVQPFVKEMGGKMDYRVAVDDVAAGAKPADGAMAKNWMVAAAQDGIPTAFIVNADGKVAWIGHPMEMDKPLKDITTGKYDLAAAANEHKERMVAKRKLRAVYQALAKARAAGDTKEMLAVIEQAVADNPNLEGSLGLTKFQALVAQPDSAEKAAEYGKHLVEAVLQDSPEGLNAIAWGVVDPDAKTKPDPRLVKLAVQAAQRADELSKGKNAAIADTLARAFFVNGEVAKAVETQERAVKLAAGTPLEKDPGLKSRLEEYRKAMK
jgi:thiol-disulfide isomerase/thioredoxin